MEFPKLPGSEPPRFRTLHEWMDGTGTNGQALIELVKQRTGLSLNAAVLSNILRGSRRCSWRNGWALHLTTGVPFESLIEWPRRRRLDQRLGRRRKPSRENLSENGNVA